MQFFLYVNNAFSICCPYTIEFYAVAITNVQTDVGLWNLKAENYLNVCNTGWGNILQEKRLLKSEDILGSIISFRYHLASKSK